MSRCAVGLGVPKAPSRQLSVPAVSVETVDAAPIQAQPKPPVFEEPPGKNRIAPTVVAQQRKPFPSTDQPAARDMPKFEVVSVKPSTTCEDGGGRGGGGMGRLNWSPGRLSLECATVMGLVRMAHVRYAEGTRTTFSRTAPPEPNPSIEGGPSWINSARYDIDAKAEGSPDLATMGGPMMRSLLDDRFKLKIRHEIGAIPVYELAAAKALPTCRQPSPESAFPLSSGRIQCLRQGYL